MSDPRIRLVLPDRQVSDALPRRQLGRILVERGQVRPVDLLASVSAQRHVDAKLGTLLQSRGLVNEYVLFAALAEQYNAQLVTLSSAPPDFSLQTNLDPLLCLEFGVVPWRRLGNVTLVATSNPERWNEILSVLPAHLQPAVMAVAPKTDLHRVIRMASASRLVDQAESRVPDDLSCRTLPAPLQTALACATVSLAALMLGGYVTFTGLYIALFTLALSMVGLGMLIKTAGAGIHLLTRTTFSLKSPLPDKLPRISLLIALHDEANIVDALIARLDQIDYPRELLDVWLIVEQNDTVTRTHLETSKVPFWINVLSVPEGEITTKPRALNYAMPFCNGHIVGIYDAEDAPHPQQLRDVVRAFAGASQKTACIQAILDFYNPTASWLARFFTVEYATWFRLILPGVARLGFAVPLGGTSVFFRRTVLEGLGGWDAHNVTEDADLGIRLARAGYKTELINSVTLEEANSELWPWIKQRSRWLKGYLITYLTHMRSPLRLLFDLGLWKFIGFQAFFLSAICQYLLAPLVWSCLLFYISLPDWLELSMPENALTWLTLTFLGMWGFSAAVYLLAISSRTHIRHWPFAFGMGIYLALGTIAIYKGAVELLVKPFFWDKTAHGKTTGTLEHDAF